MQLLIPIIFILISGGIFFTFIDPTYQKVKEKQEEVNRLDQLLDRTVEIRGIREEISARRNAITQTDLERLGKMLPQNIDNIQLILDINNIARQRSMTITDIRIDTVQDEAGSDVINVSNQGLYGQVGFNFQVVTDYANFKQFLDDMSRSLRLVDVTSITVNPIREESEFFAFDIGIKTYWLQDDEEVN